jgi:hypothetical protein
MKIEEPYIVAEGEDVYMLVEKADVKKLNPLTLAQIYHRDRKEVGEELLPVAQWMKFLYEIEAVEPPIPFTDQPIP